MTQLTTRHFDRVPKTSGIYIITTRWRRVVYVGSSVNLHKRMRDHYTRLCRNAHPNKNIQKTFLREKGVIYFNVVEICAPSALVRREQHWIDYFCEKTLNASLTASAHAGRWTWTL